jgi:hypothetical protein
MKAIRNAQSLLITALAAAAILTGGCSKSLKSVLVPNQPPTVRLTSAPYDTTGRYFYAYKLNWIGDDPDGRVVKFIYAIDPPTDGSKIPWVETTKNEQIVFFKATTPDPSLNTRAIDFHVFSIRAIDDGGDSSATVSRAFFSYTVAPSVQIMDPQPSHSSTAFVTPSVLIDWIGQDPDGQFTQKPVKYKFKLLTSGGDFPLDLAISNPDSLRRFYAPTFATWDSSSADTVQVRYTNLTPNADYLFVIVAFDEAGAYSPIFTLDTNMLRMRVLLAGAGGPKLTMFNEFFTYTYSQSSYNPSDPSKWANIEVPSDAPITFNWFASTDPGALVSYYRWRLGGDVFDETPRTNENTDITHWSTPSINTISATIGPFPRDTVLFFYIEAADNNGLKSLGTIHCTVVKPAFNKALGVVNDTRYLLDSYRVGTTTVLPPSGNWPTAAELDTFLFARGGYPYKAYPPGTISPVGVYQGYDFDTLSTRTGRGDLTVPLSQLGRFRHLIWMSDVIASGKSQNGNNLANGISALRYMNDKNRVNTLATYIKAGGRAWLMGSGIAHECQAAFDKGDGGTYTFGTELIPGRFLYDILHWRNDVKESGGTIYSIQKSPRAVPHSANAPDYSLLPPQMRLKSIALGDSMPPNRSSNFYLTQISFSFLALENFIIENVNPDPTAAPMDSSTLDTLFNDVGPPGAGVVPAPVATYYRGVDNTDVVYTAFDPWIYSKVDFVQLTDFVLQNVWGLSRSGTPIPQRPGVVAVSRPIRAGTTQANPNFHGSARALIGGGGTRATKRVLTSPGHRPQE